MQQRFWILDSGEGVDRVRIETRLLIRGQKVISRWSLVLLLLSGLRSNVSSLTSDIRHIFWVSNHGLFGLTSLQVGLI